MNTGTVEPAAWGLMRVMGGVGPLWLRRDPWQAHTIVSWSIDPRHALEFPTPEEAVMFASEYLREPRFEDVEVTQLPDGARVAGPYSIGSSHWPGLSKLNEEAGELLQVIGKLLGTGGEIRHWDGTNLKARLVEELGDLLAAAKFFVEVNGLDEEAIEARLFAKRALFYKWHREQVPLPCDKESK